MAASRQLKVARRWFVAGVLILAVAIGSASVLISIYGFSFFTFRPNGTGVSPQNNFPTDPQYLAQHDKLTSPTQPGKIKIGCVEDPGDRIICIDEGPLK